MKTSTYVQTSVHTYIYIYECCVQKVKLESKQVDVDNQPIKYAMVVKELRDARNVIQNVKKINLTLEPALKKLRVE